MTTSLVTGGAGFLGSHVAKHLLDMGHHVTVLDDLSGGVASIVLDGDLVIGSILDVELLSELFKTQQFDYVFHLAAYAAEGLSPFIRRFNYENNLIGSINLINAAVNAGTVKRFVFTSSIAVYGSPQPPFSEDMKPSPIDPYGIAKYAVEMDLGAAYDLFGLEYTIFRPHNVFGPNQNLSDPYRNVVAIFMKQCLTGQPMTIFGDGQQSRAFSYIDDVAPFIARSVEVAAARNQVINIGGDVPATINGLAAWVSIALGSHYHPVIHLPPRPEATHAWADHTKFERIFGTHPKVQPWDGIDRMAVWTKTQPLREPKPFEGIEIAKNMPESWRAYVD